MRILIVTLDEMANMDIAYIKKRHPGDAPIQNNDTVILARSREDRYEVLVNLFGAANIVLEGVDKLQEFLSGMLDYQARIDKDPKIKAMNKMS